MDSPSRLLLALVPLGKLGAALMLLLGGFELPTKKTEGHLRPTLSPAVLFEFISEKSGIVKPRQGGSLIRRKRRSRIKAREVMNPALPCTYLDSFPSFWTTYMDYRSDHRRTKWKGIVKKVKSTEDYQLSLGLNFRFSCLLPIAIIMIKGVGVQKYGRSELVKCLRSVRLWVILKALIFYI